MTPTPRDLEPLRQISSPTLANAIETFNVRPRSAGFMSGAIVCRFPELGVMVGHAVTALIRAEQAPVEGHRADVFAWWEHVLSTPAPRVVVMQDLDDPPGLGAFWGEVQANVHRALGCVGVVTDGGVRDLPEVEALGFHFFSAHVSVSHAYVHLVDFGLPVKVGGLTVRPGDLIHADRHGVLTVPPELVSQLPEAAARLEARERKMIQACQAEGVSIEALKAAWRDFRASY